MTWTYTDEEYKRYTRDTWNESAPHYGPLMQNLARYDGPLLRLARPAPGQQVLDVGTGPGEPALQVAATVGPGGAVLGVDLSKEMIDIARQRAKQAGVENATFQVMDAEALELEDDTFDLVLNRFGLQIFTDPERAIAETARVLRPGGRFATCVWASPGSLSPALDLFIAPMLEHAEPDETGYLPTPYEMGGEGELVVILESAGFKDVETERMRVDQVYPSPQHYLDTTLKGTPIGHSLREEDADVQREVMAKATTALEAYTYGGVVVIPGEAVFVAGVGQ